MVILTPAVRQKAQETLIGRRHPDWTDEVMRMGDVTLITELGVALAVELCQADEFDPSDGDARARSNQGKAYANTAAGHMIAAIEALNGR